MTPELALFFCAVLGALALFQLLLIMDLPLGRFAWGGQNEVLPARLRAGSAVAIVLYAAFATVALDRAGLIEAFPGDSIGIVAMWVVAAYLLLSVLPNLASKSRHEKRVMVPVSLVLALLAFLIALG